MPSQLPPEVLQALRDDDERNGAMRSHAIIDYRDAKRILVVVSSQRIAWQRPEEDQPSDGHIGDLWDWAYSGMKLDIPTIAKASRVGSATEEAIGVIKAARMMLPDGTPSKWARAIIEAEVADRVRKLRGPQKKEPPKK